MRISDWSSDVCSSDLRRCTRATGRPSPTSSTAGWPRARQPADSAFAAPDAGSGRYSQPVQWGAIPVPRQLIGQAQLFVREAAARNRQEEIGRASCRERVCQYVEISVVAVSLKKKLIKITKYTHHTQQTRT